jgi:replicative DNA helicase
MMEAQELDLEPFPAVALPEVLRKMAEAISASCNVPMEMSAPIVLATISGSLGKGLKTKSGPDLHIFGNLYLLGFADSGSGKTTCFKPATKPIRDFEANAQAYWDEFTRPENEAELRILEKEIAHLERMIGNKKAIIANRSEIKRDLVEKLGQCQAVRAKLHKPRIITEDTTEEALGLLLYHNSEAIFSLSPDAGKALQNLEGRYSNNKNPDDNLYVKARSGDHHAVDRVGRESIVVKEPCMALLWLTQPAKILRMLENDALSTGGFLPRCMIFDTRSEPTRLPDIEKPIPHSIKEAYNALVESLLNTYRNSHESLAIPYSEEPARLIRNFHNGLIARRQTDLRDINSFIARWHENVWCTAVVIHAAKHGPLSHTMQIHPETALNAIKIVEWFGAEQIRVLSNMRYIADLKQIDALVELIATRYNSMATMRDLERRNTWKRTEIERLADLFKDKISLEFRAPNEKGGRASLVVKIAGK